MRSTEFDKHSRARAEAAAAERYRMLSLVANRWSECPPLPPFDSSAAAFPSAPRAFELAQVEGSE
jgi:hypothetical protein